MRAIFDRTRTGAPELFYGRQRVVVALALLAGDASLVSDFCQLSRSFIRPAEHVGKQIEGVAGCRASGGSGGMAGGCDELVDTLLQAASGSASSKSIRERGSSLLVRIFRNLRLSRGAALFFGARSIYRLRLGLSGGRLHVGDLARADQVHDAGAGRRAQQRDQQIRQYRFQHHSPRSHSARSSARRFTKPGSTRPPAVTHCCRPLSASFIARHAPFQSPALNRFAVVLPQYAPVPTL